MPNIKVSLAVLNGEGVSASIENEDGDTLSIYDAPWRPDAMEGCKEAAKRLREAADLFEKLGSMKKPFHSSTHKKLNR